MNRHVAIACLRAAVGIAASACAFASPPLDDQARDIEALVGTEVVHDVVVWDKAAHRALLEHVLELAARGDPESLLAAAYLAPYHAGDSGVGITQEQRATWFAKARAQALANALLAWIEVNNCHVVLFGEMPCDRATALERLTRIDPDNAAVWVEQLADANAQGDVPRQEAVLERAASSTRYDTYDVAFGRVLLAGSAGLADRMPPISPALQRTMEEAAESGGVPFNGLTAELHALTAWSSHSWGRLQDISTACRNADGAVIESRRENCKALAGLSHENATSAIVRMVATASMIRFTEGEADNSRWIKRRRDERWQQEQAIALVGPIPSRVYARTALAQGELAAWHALMEEANLSMTAPADWQPQYGLGDP